MFQNGSWRVFLAGALCGTILMAVVGVASVWWKPRFERSARDDAIYDACLVARNGNMVACDAMMRVLDRERAAATAMKKEAAKMLAVGVSKHDVVKWAIDKGFVGSDLSDAVGITLQDLRAGNY